VYALDTNVLIAATVRSVPEHAAVRTFLKRELYGRDQAAGLTPGVVYEFVHVVSDPRRFKRALSMTQALDRARRWLAAREVRVLPPTPETPGRALELLATHGLGRKRILDTALVATLEAHGVTRLLTRNVRDFRLFGLTVIDPGRAGVTPE